MGTRCFLRIIEVVFCGIIAPSAFCSHLAEPPPTPVTITLADPEKGFQITVEGIEWRTKNMDFHMTSSHYGSPGAVETSLDAISPSLDWDGHAEITYFFNTLGRDVRLGYYRSHINHSRWKRREPVGGPFSKEKNEWDRAQGHLENDYDALELLFGQYLIYDTRLLLHPYAGVRYLDLWSRDKGAYFVNDNLPTYRYENIHYRSEFTGIGPIAGIDGEFRVWRHLNVMGKVAAMLIPGSVERVVKGRTHENATLTASSTLQSFPEQTWITPGIETRLGLDYHFIGRHLGATLGLGYDYVHYFSATDRSAYSAFGTMEHFNDLAYYGPYLRLSVEWWQTDEQSLYTMT